MPRVPPPVVALTAGMAQRSLTGARTPRGPVRTAAATSLAVAAISLAGSAANSFRRRGTTVEPFRPDEATVLVRTGANSVTRNPMYVGMAGVLAAHAIWRGSWTALVPVAGFVLFIDRLQISAEEAALQRKFGADYARYRASVPRWLDRRSVIRARS